MLDYLASEPQYVHHLGPLWAAGARQGVCWYRSEASRRAWALLGADAEAWRGHTDAPLVVASGQDFARARRAKVERVGFIEHGTGQSYGGDPRTARHSAYAGGDGRDAASIILAPNEMSAARWRDRYPQVPVHVIGATRLLPPPVQAGPPCLALAFHWSSGSREHMSALPHYRRSLARLGSELPVVGHAHPRFTAAERIFTRAGIEFVPELEDVARRATVYAVDNSSTLWEMAVHRPVIALNAPWYRRDVHHGLRFWSHIPGWQVDDAEQLLRVARHLLYVGETGSEWRRRMVVTSEVLPRFDGAVVGATLLAEWAAR